MPSGRGTTTLGRRTRECIPRLLNSGCSMVTCITGWGCVHAKNNPVTANFSAESLSR